MRRPTRRFFRRLLWTILTIYLILVCMLAGCQKTLLFPGHSSQGQKWAQIGANIDGELLHLKTAHGDNIVALYNSAKNPDDSPRADAMQRPTIVFFYGNAMSLADCIGFLKGWQRLGANTLGVEYPGYGMSGGSPGEAAFYSAADAAYDELIRRSVQPRQMIPVGLSLGTGTAVDLAARRPVGGLALFAPYTSMNAMARHVVPWMPTSLILRHHFRNDQKIGSITCPILIARGRHDSLIPPIMSQQLADAAKKASVNLLEVESDHNDLFELAGDELNGAMGRLIEQVAH